MALRKIKTKEKNMKRLIAAVVLVGIVLTSTAGATTLGTVNIQNHNNGLSDIGQLFGGGLTGGSYYTGIYSWTNTHAIGTTGWGMQIPDWGFCIELTQGPYSGWQDVIPLEEAPLPAQYGTPMGTKADYIRELWGRNFNPLWLTGGTANKKMAEAFGAAVWEIVYETGSVWDVTSGAGFHATNIDQAATANLWLSQLDGDTAYFANNLVATSAPTGQDYLVQLPVPSISVPEPATIALLGLGALSLIRRKK
jgi:hypothetical protein